MSIILGKFFIKYMISILIKDYDKTILSPYIFIELTIETLIS